MPTTRTRRTRRSTRLPPVLQAIVDGIEPEFSLENHGVLVGAKYFNEFPELSAEVHQRIIAQLQQWQRLL
jgi:hypothetical protein